MGLVSYLLIGFWYTRPTAIYANLKAFLANRVGDFGFLLGIAIVFTVFRTLDFLVEAGLAQRFEAEGHVHVYTSCADNHHHHLVCRICGSTTEIDDTAVNQLIDAVRGGYGFALDHAALDFYGTCAACAAGLTTS